MKMYVFLDNFSEEVMMLNFLQWLSLAKRTFQLNPAKSNLLLPVSETGRILMTFTFYTTLRFLLIL